MTQHTLSLPTLALASPTLPDTLPGGLPDEATCWQAVQGRDRASNGRFWFSVRTTDIIFCKISCSVSKEGSSTSVFIRSSAASGSVSANAISLSINVSDNFSMTGSARAP